MTKKWRHFRSWYTAFSFCGRILKTLVDSAKTMGTRGNINAIWWNIKINLQKLVDICGYELPTNLQNFTCYFSETPCRLDRGTQSATEMFPEGVLHIILTAPLRLSICVLLTPLLLLLLLLFIIIIIIIIYRLLLSLYWQTTWLRTGQH